MFIRTNTTNYKHCYNQLRLYQRFKSTQIKNREKPEWIQPVGYETNIRIYNPITKCKVPLILNNKNILTWYICGPTVYDSAHIGHAATYIRSDIIRRILSNYFDLNVLLIMGITDIDDKIIKRSIETGKYFKDLTKHYEREFFEDMRTLNIIEPYLYCRVTDYIPQIIEFISKIIASGGAYISDDGSVYFDTEKYKYYGKLSNPMLNSESISDIGRKSPLDFALWKAVKRNEPSWESPWGFGRPGWHIECSAIASTVFANSIDIHSGGKDLAFPHHENEEAQSCCYHKVNQWVNYWLHCGHLHLKGDVKMAKSLKNTISIKEHLEKYSENHLRMLCLLSHYRNDIEFSNEAVNNASSLLKKIENFLNDCENYIRGKMYETDINEVSLLCALDETKSNVYSALSNDFNTAQAVHAIFDLINIGNKMLHGNKQSANISESKNIIAVAAVSNYVSDVFTKFGILNSASRKKDYNVEQIIEHFVKFRCAVRDKLIKENFEDKVLTKACDELRVNLSSCGVTIKDSKTTSTWNMESFQVKQK